MQDEQQTTETAVTHTSTLEVLTDDSIKELRHIGKHLAQIASELKTLNATLAKLSQKIK